MQRGKDVEKESRKPTSSFVYSNTRGEPIARCVSLFFERWQKDSVIIESQRNYATSL